MSAAVWRTSVIGQVYRLNLTIASVVVYINTCACWGRTFACFFISVALVNRFFLVPLIIAFVPELKSK